MLTKRAQPRQRRFFIRGKQQPIERRLRVVELRQRRRLAGRRLARLRRRHARREPVPQTANKRILKRRENFIHFAAAGHDAAGRQQDAVVKALANDIAQGVLNGGIALTFIEFVLIVVEQVTDLVLLAEMGQPFDAGGKIIRLFDPQRYAPFRQRGVQTVQMADDKRGLPRRQVMLTPLPRGGDIQRQHLRLRIPAGGGQRQVIVNA